MLRNKHLLFSVLGAAVASTLGHSAAPVQAAEPPAPVLGADLAEPLSDTELEQRVEALKPTAPRITKEHIQSLIVDETYTNIEGTRTTVCRLGLANGFCVVGVNNGPVSAANFNQEIGCEYAYKAAVDQIWPLEGYLLAERLSRVVTEDGKINSLRKLVQIQCAEDTVDQDEYMRGMANGLMLALSVLTGQEPDFVEAPNTSYQDRVRAERAELDERATKLGAFLQTDTFAGLDEAEQERLKVQLDIQYQLREVLDARIAAF